jgi:hypothetical protein
MSGRSSRNLAGGGQFLTIIQTPEKTVEVFAAKPDLQPKRRLFLIGERHLRHIPPIPDDGSSQELQVPDQSICFHRCIRIPFLAWRLVI